MRMKMMATLTTVIAATIMLAAVAEKIPAIRAGGTFFVYAPSLNDVEIPDFPFCVGVFRLVHPPLGAMSSRLLFRRDLVPLSRAARCHVIPTAL